MRTVVFDLDGTLIGSLPQITEAANAVLAQDGLPALTPAQVTGFVGLGEQVFVDRLIAATDLQAAQRAEIMGRFMVAYEKASENSALFPGVEAVLDLLAGQGVRMGLCTNKPGGPLARVLEVTGLRRFMTSVVAGDRLMVRKPDPAPLLLAFEELGGRGVYVGDSAVDAETARRAGVPFAFYTEGIRTGATEDIPHDAAFDDFVDLPWIVARLA